MFAHFVAAVGYQCLRDEQAVATQAEASSTLATQYGFPYWIAIGSILRGWSQGSQGDGLAGIAEIRKGLVATQELGLLVHRAHFLTLLAEAVGRTGDSAQALEVIKEAEAQTERSGERFYEAETWRVKGELTLQSKVKSPRSKVGDEAEECFQKALAVARQQDAKSLELRAAMSLSRLWQQQGKTAEAWELLVPIYEWFTEGFETPDLLEAKALLETL